MIMSAPSRSLLAARFRALHARDHLLVLPNAWDVASARLIEVSGAEAIATTSAALAWSLGYTDGEELPLDLLVATVATITQRVSIPVTVDFVLGYSEDPERVAAAVLRLIDAGAVGVNLEDGDAPPELLAQKIRAVRKAVAARAVDVFINARIDVYLRGLVPPAEAVAETVRRARIYAEAGCDGLFAAKVTSPDDIKAILRETDLPLNVMLVPGIASIADLRSWGVRRLSAGPGLAEVAYGAARRACNELLQQGSYAGVYAGEMTYPEMNGLFQR